MGQLFLVRGYESTTSDRIDLIPDTNHFLCNLFVVTGAEIRLVRIEEPSYYHTIPYLLIILTSTPGCWVRDDEDWVSTTEYWVVEELTAWTQVLGCQSKQQTTDGTGSRTEVDGERTLALGAPHPVPSATGRRSVRAPTSTCTSAQSGLWRAPATTSSCRRPPPPHSASVSRLTNR